MDNSTEIINTATLWVQFSHPLKRFIRQKVKNEIDAEDILQEVFIKVHLKKETVKDKAKIQSWIYQVTRNTITDFHRHPKPELKIKLDHLVATPYDEPSSSPADCIPQFLNRLPEKY